MRLFVFFCYYARRDLHSFPTRRSSDLSFKDLGMTVLVSMVRQMIAEGAPIEAVACASTGDRSEEHTSELQSQFHLVCRLLLEKKNVDKQASQFVHIPDLS